MDSGMGPKPTNSGGAGGGSWGGGGVWGGGGGGGGVEVSYCANAQPSEKLKTTGNWRMQPKLQRLRNKSRASGVTVSTHEVKKLFGGCFPEAR